jgi:molybdopterin molybdotransferase
MSLPPKGLPSVEEARGRMLAWAEVLPAETVALADALGRTLAEDIHALRDQPPYVGSAMDGWAVRTADTPGRLRIVGESAAGAPFEAALGIGEAVRIFTGAALPPGADAVVIQEEASREGDLVVVPAAPLGDYVRPAGCDFRGGERLLAKGMRLDAWRLSLAAAGGRGALRVARQPQVRFLSTGEEIIDPGQTPGPYQIFDAGTSALVALASGWGAQALRLKPVRDDLDATVAAVKDEACDLIVTVGGASVGDHDLVKPALKALGLELAVESINLRPGKPTWFGRLADGRRVLGLPGNPASSLVCAELFLRPLLAAMQGASPTLELTHVRAGADFPKNAAREHWMRARLSSDGDGVLRAEAFADQDSSLVSVFANADALVRRAAGAPALAAGELIEALALGRA